MGLFDWYEPDPPLTCPVCGRPLSRWQGKDGPREMFVWRQGRAAPVGILLDDVDPIVALGDGEPRLPRRFRLKSWDCERHHPVEAEGETAGGVWVRTRLVEPGVETPEVASGSAQLTSVARRRRKANGRRRP
jgi:hypothetical protein